MTLTSAALKTKMLDGIRVLDLTTVVMGPLASMILGDMGADVIKVESLDGDISRQSVPARSRGMGQAFLAVNRNKRSLAINLKTDEGRKALLALAAKADVLTYNIRPQAMSRLGLGYEDLAAVNPKIIYVGGFGFSQRGPYAAKAAYDDVLQGMMGMPWMSAAASDNDPRYVPVTFADRTVALHVAMAVFAALYHRERTCQGQRIDVPMFENLVMMVFGEHLEGKTFIPPIGELGHARSMSKERRPFQTKDGYLCTLIYNDLQWKRFLSLIGRSELFTSDERFSSHSQRIKNVDYVYAFLSETLRTRTTAEWLAEMGKLDIPCGPMNSLEDILQDEHLNTLGYFKEIDHPTEGKIRAIVYPSEFSGVQVGYFRHAPRLGEHTREVLGEAGYSDSHIEDLATRGIVKLAAPSSPQASELSVETAKV